MGLFGKVKQAKGFVKGLQAMNESNPLKFSITTMIENGKQEPDETKLTETAMQTQNDYARGLIFECLDDYLDYQGNDWERVYKTLKVLYAIAIFGSEQAVEDIKTRLPQVKTLMSHPRKEVGNEAKELIELFDDEEFLKESRQKNPLSSIGVGGMVIGGGQVNNIGQQ